MDTPRKWKMCACEGDCTLRPMEEREREALREALVHFYGNRTHSAKALGISLRTLRNWIQKYKSSVQDITNEVSVKCLVCNKDFLVSHRTHVLSVNKVFYCGADCVDEMMQSKKTVLCKWCQKRLEVRLVDYYAKASGRFFCDSNCIRLFNKHGDPQRCVTNLARKE